MTSTRRRRDGENVVARTLAEVVETTRRRKRISLRTAADRAGISEGTWRQLVAGGVNVGGRWVRRTPRRDQVLDMAMAVDCLEEAARMLGATEVEVMDARSRVILADPAEDEILALKHLRPSEKLHLIQELQRLRDE